MGLDTVLIAGAGALGSLYGHRFLQKKETWFLADGSRKAKLEKDGIIVNKRHYSVKCADQTSNIKPDLIIIAVKYNNLPEILDKLAQFITPDTLIISVMNGIDSEDMIRSRFADAKLVLAVVLGMDAVRQENSVTFTKEGKIVFNKYDSLISDNDISSLKKLFDECGIASEIPDDIKYELWFKFMINSGVNQVSAVLGANYGFMKQNKYAREIMDITMEEVIAVANAVGVNLQSADIKKWYKILDSLGDEGKTSMYQDIEQGRKTEVEMFSGKLIEIGTKLNIDVTINKILYNLIKAKEDLTTIKLS